MRKSTYGLLVLMAAVVGVTGCQKGREAAEENIAWETRAAGETQKETEEPEQTTAGQDAGTEQGGAGESAEEKTAAGAEGGTAADTEIAKSAGLGQQEPAPADQDRAAMLKAYRAALEGIFYDQVYPDGTDCGFDNYGSISDNLFAVYDVDRDGRDELMVLFSTSSMAGMREAVYGYDSAADSLVLELSEFPGAVYYDNGVVLVDWSHNQGLAGDFWPYNVYQYDPGTDRYDMAASVDAWDRSLADTDYSGNSYPVDVDVNNDGIVFYIMPGGTYDMEHPVGMRDYKAWYNSVLGGAQEMTIPYLSLTAEHIDGIR